MVCEFFFTLQRVPGCKKNKTNKKNPKKTPTTVHHHADVVDVVFCQHLELMLNLQERPLVVSSVLYHERRGNTLINKIMHKLTRCTP